MVANTTTKLQIEESPSGLLISEWDKGWQEGDPANRRDFLEGKSLQYDLVPVLDKAGFVTYQVQRGVFIALRGEITRIDFVKVGDCWSIRKWPYGWTASTPFIREETKANFDIHAALNWCRENGWTVREWLNFSPSGARAWLGKPLPVRDAHTIKAMRRRQQKYPDFYRYVNFDIAFDL